MDPLSVSASIVALFQSTGKVISCLSDIKNGPKELNRIRLEVSNVLSILYMLQDQADQAKQGDVFASTLGSLNVPNGPFQQFRATLERLASKLTPGKGWRKIGSAFQWPLEKEEIREILATTERLKTLFSLARQNDHIALSKDIRSGIQTMNKEFNEITVGITNIQITERHKKIRQWLNASDPSLNYNRALKDRQVNTGGWFLTSNSYVKWLSKSGSLLWLYGILGCGKTILSSTIIQSTIEHCQSRASTAVLYFYFDFNDVEKRRHEKMIRSLIVQLFSQRMWTSQALEALYLSCTDGEHQPTSETLLKTLHQMLGFEDTYLVIDALDECLERHELMENIEELTRWTDRKLHILITSRPESIIAESLNFLSNEERICIHSKRVDTDIRVYVQDRLRTDRDLKRWHRQPEIHRKLKIG
ncbi:MAG: hypothetical protein Q9194_007643 [Teloschistes cf. exilis]